VVAALGGATALAIATVLACAPEPAASGGLFGDRPRSTLDDEPQETDGAADAAADDAPEAELDASADDGASADL
jgi:hypothetical protein